MKKYVYEKSNLQNNRKKDYPKVCNLICTSFVLDDYVSDAKTLELVNKRYLCSSLAEQTYNLVAEVDGQVVGVIMGASDHAKHTAATAVNALQSLFYSLRIILFHRKPCSGQGNIHQAYGDLIRDRRNQYDGVLTLFIVQEKFRGFGIGRVLLRAAQEYWKAQGTSSSYLYTDDTCNYGFYEHMGFTRANERKVDILRNGKKAELGVYLYEYQGGVLS